MTRRKFCLFGILGSIFLLGLTWFRWGSIQTLSVFHHKFQHQTSTTLTVKPLQQSSAVFSSEAEQQKSTILTQKPSRGTFEDLTKPKINFVEVPRLKELENQFGSREWRTYLPEVDDLLTKIEQGVIKWPVDIKLTTDPRSSVIILPNSDNLKVGDKLSGSIQARDFHGNAKTHGGDHFRARLKRISETGTVLYDGIAVMVKDYMNGTYGWNTIIPWPGRCKLIIELIHSSEAVAELIVRRATLVNKRRGYFSRYSDKEVVRCDITTSNLKATRCDYSRPELGISWICEKPDNNSTCPSAMAIAECTILDDSILGDEPLFKKSVTWKVELKNSGTIFSSKGDVKDMPRAHDECNILTGMKRFTMQINDFPNGYYYEEKWVSLLCDNKHKDLSKASQCLRHKSVYYIGDSTMRQWYHLSSALQVQQLPPLPDKNVWSSPRNGYSKEYDVDIHYRAHGNPLQNPGPPPSRPFVVDTLQSITANRTTVVVFNIGAHFFPYDPSLLLQRAAGVKNALIDLHKRLPRVLVFYRGTISYTGSFQGPLSEWLYMRTDRILGRYFSDLPFVGHINSWEMTTIVPQYDVHASVKDVTNFMSLFLSYMY